MDKTKRSMLACGISIVLCLVLLIGTTFAWFTDSVTNTGNVIAAGNLSINAYVYELGEGGQKYAIPGVNGGNTFTFEQDADREDLSKDTSPIINESLWEPGKSSAKLLKVENTGTLATKIKLDFKITDSGLEDALWFDFIQVDGENVTGAFTKRPINTLSDFAENLELPLLENGDSVQFILIYGMYEEAGNEYQGKTFSADVNVLATQATYETDGFGSNQYDIEAEYDTVDVSNADEFQRAIDSKKNINMTADITLADAKEFSYNAVVDINDHTLTINSGSGSLKAMPNYTLTVYGNGTINGALVANENSKLVVKGDEKFNINSNFVTGAAISTALNSTLEVYGGTYTSSVKGGAGVINALGTNLTIKNATVNVGVDSVVNSMGINGANAKTALLENVVVNAKFSTAVNLNNMYGSYIIRGGRFSTSMQADGFNPNPTIKYQGSLDISDTVIERIGLGIKYNKVWPKPTEPENLTMTNVVFQAVDGAVGEDVGC